jgi:hypothetical protein
MKLDEYDKPVIRDAKDFAEVMLDVYRSVAFNEDGAISASDTMTYKLARNALMVSIAIAYPESDIQAVYDIWLDCNENVAYCVDAAKNRQRDETLGRYVTYMEDIQDMTDAPTISPSFYDGK